MLDCVESHDDASILPFLRHLIIDNHRKDGEPEWSDFM